MDNNLELPKLKSNKKRSKLQKRPLIFLATLMFLITISITYALFFSTASIANRFETMKYNVTLEEEFYDDWGTKKVYITNNEKATPVVVRVSYIEMWSKASGEELLTLSNKINGKDVVNKAWTNTWKNDFIDGKDGWYYYKKVLNPGNTIQILDSIEVDEGVIKDSPYEEDYQKYDYELTFNYESIQATENAVKELWDKNITINNNNITWNQ